MISSSMNYDLASSTVIEILQDQVRAFYSNAMLINAMPSVLPEIHLHY